MLIGYARTSTAEQTAGLEAQERDLQAQGAEKVFAERVSSVAAQRPQLAALIDFAREGDTVIVTKPCRLARSVADLLSIQARLAAKGVRLRILSMDMDTSSPTGKLTLTILAGVAQFERELMLERQREGIAKAKAQGVYRGRVPTAMRQADEIRLLRTEGNMKPNAIASLLGISRASVYRALAATKAPQDQPEPT